MRESGLKPLDPMELPLEESLSGGGRHDFQDCDLYVFE